MCCHLLLVEAAVLLGVELLPGAHAAARAARQPRPAPRHAHAHPQRGVDNVHVVLVTCNQGNAKSEQNLCIGVAVP